MQIGNYETHPAADIFPMMDDAELRELAKDIEANGLSNPIIQHEGKILDGRNRLKACIGIDVEPEFIQYHGTSPTAFVVSQNLHRRHLTASQKAMIGAKLKPAFAAEAKERQRARTGNQPGAEVEIVPPLEKAKARDAAADAVGVSGKYVDQAEYVLKNDPAAASEVEQGKISLPQALKTIRRKNPIPRKARGSYDEWRQFKSIAKQIHDLIKQLKPLEADSMHQHERNQTVKALIEELKGL